MFINILFKKNNILIILIIMKYLIILIILIIFYIFLNKINKPEDFKDFDAGLAKNIYLLQEILKNYNNTNKSININNTTKNNTAYYLNNEDKDNFGLNMEDIYKKYTKRKKIIIPKNVNLNGLIVLGNSHFKSDIVDNYYFEVNGSDNRYPHHINFDNKTLNFRPLDVYDVKPRLPGGLYGKYIDKMNRGLYFGSKNETLFAIWETAVNAKYWGSDYVHKDIPRKNLHTIKILIKDASKEIKLSELYRIFGEEYINNAISNRFSLGIKADREEKNRHFPKSGTLDGYRFITNAEIEKITSKLTMLKNTIEMKAEYFTAKNSINNVPILKNYDRWLLEYFIRPTQYDKKHSFDSCFTDGFTDISKEAIKQTDYSILDKDKTKNKYLEFLKKIPNEVQIND